MRKTEIAQELVKIARSIIALQFSTQKQLDDYKKNHDVRKTTKLTLKKDNSSSESKKESVKNLLRKKINKMSQEKQMKMFDKWDINSDVLDVLADSKSANVRKKVSEHPDTSAETLQRMSNHHSLTRGLGQNIAKHPNTSAKTLNKLSYDGNSDVRQNVAKNKNTSSETLDRLSDDKDFLVRYGVASNPHTSSETLDKLSDNDLDYYLRWSVAGNKNTSEKTLNKLMNDKDEQVRNTAKYNLAER